MRVAHLSDCHLGKKSPKFGDPQGAERLNSFRQAVARVSQESPQALLLAGDVFDGPHVDRAVVQEAARALNQLQNPAGEPIPVVLIPGNHDPSSAAPLWNTFRSALTGPSVVRPVLVPEVVSLAEGKILVEAYPCDTPYSAEAPWARRVNLGDHPSGSVRVVLAHGTLQGGPVPEDDSDAYPFSRQEAEALGADYVALGHFHGIYPPWTGGEEIERGLSYSGSHEPDQFEGEAGYGLVVALEPGRPARLRRLRVGRRCWRRVEIASPMDLDAAEALKREVQASPEPSRFVVRLFIAPKCRLAPEEGAQLDEMAASLRALGAHVDRRGEAQAVVDVAGLDLDSLPSGAVKEALKSLRDERALEKDERRQAVLDAAIQLGWEKLQEGQ